MSEREITEIIEAARIFARDYHTRKTFDGFTESEVMKGVAAVHIALHMVRETKYQGEELYNVLSDTLKHYGILDSGRERVLQVYEIVSNILRKKEESTHEN